MANADEFPELYYPDANGDFIFEKPGWNDELMSQYEDEDEVGTPNNFKLKVLSEESMKVLESYFLLRSLAERARQHEKSTLSLSSMEVSAIEFAYAQLQTLLNNQDIDSEHEYELEDEDEDEDDEESVPLEEVDFGHLNLDDDDIPF